MTTRDPIAELASSALDDVIDTMSQLTDQLRAFRDGDHAAWTDRHSLAIHQTAVRAQAAVGATRGLAEAQTRLAAVIPFEAPQQRP